MRKRSAEEKKRKQMTPYQQQEPLKLTVAQKPVLISKAVDGSSIRYTTSQGSGTLPQTATAAALLLVLGLSLLVLAAGVRRRARAPARREPMA